MFLKIKFLPPVFLLYSAAFSVLARNRKTPNLLHIQKQWCLVVFRKERTIRNFTTMFGTDSIFPRSTIENSRGPEIPCLKQPVLSIHQNVFTLLSLLFFYDQIKLKAILLFLKVLVCYWRRYWIIAVVVQITKRNTAKLCYVEQMATENLKCGRGADRSLRSVRCIQSRWYINVWKPIKIIRENQKKDVELPIFLDEPHGGNAVIISKTNQN